VGRGDGNAGGRNPSGTVGAKGCVASASKKGLLHQALISAHAIGCGGKPSCPYGTAFGNLGTFTPKDSMPVMIKAARGPSLMEQSSLNPPTPSAGSTHQRFRADRPYLLRKTSRPYSVGNL